MKILRLKFNVLPKGYFQMDIDEPKDELTSEEIMLAVEQIIEAAIFAPKNGELGTINTASIIEETVTTIF